MLDDFEQYMRDKRSERDTYATEFWKDFFLTLVACALWAVGIALFFVTAPSIRSLIA